MSDRSVTRYQFLDHDVPDDVVTRLADDLVLFDTWHRTHVRRLRTQEFVGVPNRRGLAA